MTVAWPSDLPMPELQGYGLQPATAVHRIPFEIGAPRVVRRTSRPIAEVAVSWAMDGAQQALFDGFYTYDAMQGEAWFEVDLAFPVGITTTEARFKGPVAMRHLGGTRWQATATLDLRERPTLTEAELDELLDDAGDPPTWPDVLPQPDLRSWEIAPKPAVARGDDLPGLPQQRQRSRNSLAEVQTRWELTADQAPIFDAFFRFRALDGAQWFDFPFYQGIGIVETKARFLGDADWTPRAGGRWAVTAPIEVRERVILTADDLELINSGGDLDDLLAAIEAVHAAVERLLALTILRHYLAGLRVTEGALPGVYEGGWRVAPNGRISPYFMFSAMTLAPERFSPTYIKQACAMVLDQMTVGRRANSSTYANPTLVCFASGKVFFCNLGGTTAGSAPSDAAITTAGTFLVDGTVTWEYTGLALPAAWQWYPIEIEANLFTKLVPDSNDSYAAMLISAALAGGVDASWLNAASAHPGKSRLDVLVLLASNCISDDIVHDLSATFQSETHPDGSAYNIQWLADNCEAWRGMRALASLHTIVGNAAAATAANAVAAALKTGILALWDSGAGRFRAYYGETGVGSLAGETDFVQRLRFHIWPLLHGVLSGGEIATYGEAVHDYVSAAVPTLFTGLEDEFFVVSEYFFAVDAFLDVEEGRDTLLTRSIARYEAGGVTVADAALTLAAAALP